MFIAKTLTFYKRLDVQRALLEQARDKEVSVKFQTYFGKRPDALFSEGDVMEFAKKKASSFHCSEELWHNPLQIQTGMSAGDIRELRKGWDLILDIDCPYWPLSKLITHLFVKSLEAHDISCITVKFSGNKGFHIAVPFEAFPEQFNGQETKDLFPEAPRRIAYYLLDYLARHYVEDKDDILLFDKQYKIRKEKLATALGKEVRDFTTADQDEKLVKIPLLCRSCGYIDKTTEQGRTNICPVCNGILEEQHVHQQKPEPELAVFDPLTIIEVDTILIAHRHLYRMPYSFHEKSELISVPVPKDGILKFSKKHAEPGKVDLAIPFLDRTQAKPGEANKLLIAAYDYNPQLEEEQEGKKEYEIPKEAIPEDYFPPCMKLMLQGLKDGRKRALFTIINFLRGAGWSFDQIEETLLEWNEKNDEPLRMVSIKGRLRYEKTKKQPLPPHNCKRYYQDFGVCKPDAGCERIKNPLQYAKIKAEKAGLGDTKGGRQKLTDEQKAMRRAYRERKKQE